VRVSANAALSTLSKTSFVASSPSRLLRCEV
jgi:hypothetical protein